MAFFLFFFFLFTISLRLMSCPVRVTLLLLLSHQYMYQMFLSPGVDFLAITFTYGFHILIATHTFQYCKSKLYITLGGGDKTLKKKKETLINTPPTPLFSNSHFSFLISFGFKRCS